MGRWWNDMFLFTTRRRCNWNRYQWVVVRASLQPILHIACSLPGDLFSKYHDEYEYCCPSSREKWRPTNVQLRGAGWCFTDNLPITSSVWHYYIFQESRDSKFCWYNPQSKCRIQDRRVWARKGQDYGEETQVSKLFQALDWGVWGHTTCSVKKSNRRDKHHIILPTSRWSFDLQYTLGS